MPSIMSYFRAFSPAPRWDRLPAWPPDVFALANLVLDHTECYRFAIAPPTGRRWPPTPDWNDRVVAAARDWSAACGRPPGEPPELVQRCWRVLTGSRDISLSEIRSGHAWETCEALLTLHAVADEACATFVVGEDTRADRPFEARARRLLEERGSLSHLSPSRVRIVPKSHFTSRGITIRSLSRYLALCYESVDVAWRRVDPVPGHEPPAGPRDYNILLVPWPLSVKASDFRQVPTVLDNMDLDVFGFFEFSPAHALDAAYMESLLAAAERTGRVDAVVLPEAAVEPAEIAMIEGVLEKHDTAFLVAGVRERPTTSAFGRNYLHFGVRTPHGWERYEQDKHHRWCLDTAQVRQYHLTRSLRVGKHWWEAIDIRARMLNVIDVGRGTTATPLVCEDLARMDEVADLVRRIGPTLVIAVLLDGPQLASRWPFRYASVLADEPGSAVLTLTSFGMATRSRPPGLPPSRVVALWNDSRDGLHELALGRGAEALLVTATAADETGWTADGRRHGNVPGISLSAVHQVRLAAPRRPGTPRVLAEESVPLLLPGPRPADPSEGRVARPVEEGSPPT